MLFLAVLADANHAKMGALIETITQAMTELTHHYKSLTGEASSSSVINNNTVASTASLSSPPSHPAATAGSRLPRVHEKQRWKEAIRNAKSQGYKIKGFYHVSAWRAFWDRIIVEQMMILDGRRPHQTDYEIPYNDTSPMLSWGEPHWVSLLNAVDQLYINVVGPHVSHLRLVQDLIERNVTLHPKHRAKLAFHFNKTIARSSFEHMSKEDKRRVMSSKEHLSEAEVSTVTSLHEYCVDETRAGRKALVFYIHNKGSCCYPRISWQTGEWAVAGWRDVMNAFNIEFPSICLRALLMGYSTCGYGSQLGHYTGNFWWADCGHIAALPPLWSKFDAYAVEYFIMNVSLANKDVFERNCAYETYHCLDGRIDHYAQHCPRNQYMERINNFVNPVNPTAWPRIKNSKVDLAAAGKEGFCRDAWRKGRYMDAPGWKEHDKSLWRE